MKKSTDDITCDMLHNIQFGGGEIARDKDKTKVAINW